MTINDYLNTSIEFQKPENKIFLEYFLNEYDSFNFAYNDITYGDKLWKAFKVKRKPNFDKLDKFINNNLDGLTSETLGFIQKSKSNATAQMDGTGGYQGFNAEGDFSKTKSNSNSLASNDSQNINIFDEYLKIYGSAFASLFAFTEEFIENIIIHYYPI